MRQVNDKCGTYAGWMVHRRAGEKACAFCKSAHAEYMKAYRADPTRKRRNAQQRAAYHAALKELGHRYPEEYQALYTEALAKERGIDLKRGAA